MIPITIITGFLGSGKTTILLSLLPQLPRSYKLAVLKNEFGDVAVDSQLAAAGSVSGVRELLNGCICCNLVGQLGDALDELALTHEPDRIVIETSGSAHPATLALEVNRLARERANEQAAGTSADSPQQRQQQHESKASQQPTGISTGATAARVAARPRYVLDGVAVVIDVENWSGYADTSYTAKLQARYTDLVILNKWEEVSERRMDEVLDRLGDLDVPVARVRSDRGKVDAGVLLGMDGGMAKALEAASNKGEPRSLPLAAAGPRQHAHDHDHDHVSEVEVLSVALLPVSPAIPDSRPSVDLDALETLLLSAPKDEVYRIKAVLSAASSPARSDGTASDPSHPDGEVRPYALNWAFGRWTFTPLRQAGASTATETSGEGAASEAAPAEQDGRPSSTAADAAVPLPAAAKAETAAAPPVLRMTLVTGRGEADGWRRRVEGQGHIKVKTGQARLVVERVL